MSLHAQLPPETLARLQAQRRNSTISSLIMAVLFMVMVALVCAIILLPGVFTDTTRPPSYTSARVEMPEVEAKRFDPSFQRKPAPAPASASARNIAVDSVAPVSIPMPEVDSTEPGFSSGIGDDFGEGDGLGTGIGSGPKWGPINGGISQRCSPEERMRRLLETGGTEECETAVVKALDWLKATQNPDGSWTGRRQAAMTGLALLAFLGHCETPLSEQYGETVLKAMVYLVNLGGSHGKLTTDEGDRHWPYEHAIATYALAEATTICAGFNLSVPGLAEVTRRAGQFVIDNQNQSGGWDYAYVAAGPRGGDLSITAWHIQALKACEHTGLEFVSLQRSANRAVAYVSGLQNSSGGFGYANTANPAGELDYFTLTGAGVLSLQMWDRGAQAAVRSGARYMDANTRFEYDTEFCDLYGHYYEAQAMMNRGGEQWRRYNALFRDQLLKNQNPDGSWKNPGGGGKVRAAGVEFTGGSAFNVHYRTCLATLMLEVYYRYLPGTGAAR